MKKSFFFYILIAGVFSSCNKYLDKTPDEDLTLEETFSERRSADRFLTAAYSHLPFEDNFHEWYGRNPFIGGSDEMEITWDIAFAQQMNTGSWNPYNVTPDIWSTGWQGLRKVNIFLENIHLTPISEEERNRMIAEARFLRAILHFFELRSYGAIPIADKSLILSDNFKAIERQPFHKCVEFIVNECDEAAAALPLKREGGDLGRPSKAAALALKARVLLYAASPLFNGNPDYQDLKNASGDKLYPVYDANKWAVAAAAAKECIDACEPVYKLYRASDNDPMNNYKKLFEENWNDEVLFARNNDGTASYSSFHERCANPISLSGLSGYAPTQEIVDEYEMMNGERPITGYDVQGNPIINPTSGYTETGFAAAAHPKGYYPASVSNMYVDRDPRFYATINFNGAFWKNQQLQFWNTGLDGYQLSNKVDYTKTGYLLRKFLSPAVNLKTGIYVLRTWIYFRLAEQYLNYAEAINEAEGPANAYQYVNAVRDRAGMPPLPSGLSKEQMRERIRHERRIELAFETHRYFDTRRWKLAAATDNTTIHGMNVRAGSSLTDPEFYKRTIIEKRIFESPKHYLFPVPQADIDKTPALMQNPGW
jgi:SusD family.